MIDWKEFDEIWRFLVEYKPRLDLSEIHKPPVNVFETGDRIVVEVALPGVEKQDVRVEFTEGVLRIYGIRRDLHTEDERKFHVVEISYGPFERRVYVGEEVDIERIESRLENGLLTIDVPKKIFRFREIEIEKGE